MTRPESPASLYSTDPNRTPIGAREILRRELEETLEAAQLAANLEGDFEGSRHNRQLLEIIEIRLREARLLAARL